MAVAVAHEPDHVVVDLPTKDDIDRVQKILRDVATELEVLDMHLRNVGGRIESEQQWQARLRGVPTFEDIGALWTFVHLTRERTDEIGGYLDSLEVKGLEDLEYLRAIGVTSVRDE